MSTDAKPFRLLPAVTPENEHFWRGGAEGELRFLYCEPCEGFIHPPQPRCPRCLSAQLEVRATSGRAHLHTFTINHQPWIPGFDPPYVVAIVTLAEQADVRLTTNIVGCEPDALRIGMPLQVRFEACDDGVFLPLFEPAEATT